MDLRRLRYFVAVAQELHFGRAAAKLGLSQPPLSAQIQTLESELQLQLFERSKRHVRLTPAGCVLLNEARGLLDHAQRVRHVMRGAASGESGQVIIGCVLSSLYTVLPELIRRCREQFPQLGLIVEEGYTIGIIEGLREGRLDVGFLWEDNIASPLGSKVVYDEDFVLALPDSHSLARRRRVDLAELAGEQLIMFNRKVSPHHYDRVMSGLDQAKVTPRAPLEARSVPAQVGFVASGLGVAVVPAFATVFGSDRVVFRNLMKPLRTVGITCAWHRENTSSPTSSFLSLI